MLKSILPEIQIFIFCVKKLDGYTDDITFINDISVYASLMNDARCKAVITEFSGGGQLAQYCHNEKILYYCNAYPFYTGVEIGKVIREANEPNNLYDYFDVKLHTGASIYIFSTFDSLLTNFKRIYFDDERKIVRM
jgi:hypothetical protein